MPPFQKAFRSGVGVLAVLLFGVLAASCGLTEPKKPPPPCPPVLVLKDAATITKFRPGPGRDITDVTFTGRISDFRAECTFAKDLSEVDIRMNIAFVLNRGPANRDRKLSFDYFVAIPYFHPAPQGKQVFTRAGEFEGNRGRIGFLEEVNMTIPLAPDTKREDYRIFIGFQLSGEEVEFNRSRTDF